VRTKDEILKEFIDVKGGFMMKQQEKAVLLNPRLLLEVLLDIRELLLKQNVK
jgi:hypothetical protein